MRLEKKLLRFCVSNPADIDFLKRVVEELPIELGSYDSTGNYSLEESGLDFLLVVPGDHDLFFYVDIAEESSKDINELRNNIVPLREGIKIETFESKGLGKLVEVNTGKTPTIYFGFWKGNIIGGLEEVGKDIEYTQIRP